MKPSSPALIISDTNILSSFAACDSLELLFRLFANTQIQIPLAVLGEVQVGFARGRSYLNTLLQAVADQKIVVVSLTANELGELDQLPQRLNRGEREAIVVAQRRQGILLSNDHRAVRYCQQQQIRFLCWSICCVCFGFGKSSHKMRPEP